MLIITSHVKTHSERCTELEISKSNFWISKGQTIGQASGFIVTAEQTKEEANSGESTTREGNTHFGDRTNTFAFPFLPFLFSAATF